MTNSNKSVFIDRNTSHIKHGWQEKRMIMEYNVCVSCALIGHNFPTVLQLILALLHTKMNNIPTAAAVLHMVYNACINGCHVLRLDEIALVIH